MCRTIRVINRRIRTLYRVKPDRRLNASEAFRDGGGGNVSRLAGARDGRRNDRGCTGILADNDIENPCEGRAGAATSSRCHGDTCRKDLKGTGQNDHWDTRSIDHMDSHNIDHRDSRNDC